MRAAILHGDEDLRVEEVPDPEPAAGEVVVHVEAATTCGTDVKSTPAMSSHVEISVPPPERSR